MHSALWWHGSIQVVVPWIRPCLGCHASQYYLIGNYTVYIKLFTGSMHSVNPYDMIHCNVTMCWSHIACQYNGCADSLGKNKPFLCDFCDLSKLFAPLGALRAASQSSKRKWVCISYIYVYISYLAAEKWRHILCGINRSHSAYAVAMVHWLSMENFGILSV